MNGRVKIREGSGGEDAIKITTLAILAYTGW